MTFSYCAGPGSGPAEEVVHFTAGVGRVQHRMDSKCRRDADGSISYSLAHIFKGIILYTRCTHRGQK